MTNAPLYVSLSTTKSLWQEYRIYTDRLEFSTLLGVLSIPFSAIEEAETAPSDVAELLHGRLHLRNFRPALKLDWANFQEHIVLDTTQGFVHRILFTPENPGEFKNVLDRALADYRSGAAGSR